MFVYGFKSANVSGFGEVVKEFKEDIPKIKPIFVPEIKSQTKQVFQTFRKFFSKEMKQNNILAKQLIDQPSKKILKNHSNISLNDLLKPFLKLYPQAYEFKEKQYFLSGSGSTFFEVVDNSL